MRYEFDATIQRLEGKMVWPVIYMSFDVEEAYGTKSRFNVWITLDGYRFQGTLLPSKNGHYIVFNQAMKQACQKELGDTVHVEVEPDREVRVVEVPEDLQAVFIQHPVALEEYEKLPDYLKREAIQAILDAKKLETREKRIHKLIEKLHQRPDQSK